MEVERAAYELALAELASPGAATPSVTMGRLAKSQKAETIEREFFGPSDGVTVTADSMRPILTKVEDLLRCILARQSASAGASVDLLRV